MPNLRTLSFAGLMFVAIFCVGCYRPVIAPAVQYDDADAALLREELQTMDWD